MIHHHLHDNGVFYSKKIRITTGKKSRKIAI